MILAGLLSDQPAVSAFGWAALGFVVLLLVLRTILWDYMAAGKIRAALIGLAILIGSGCSVIGGLQIFKWVTVELEEVQVATSGMLQIVRNSPSFQRLGPAGN